MKHTTIDINKYNFSNSLSHKYAPFLSAILELLSIPLLPREIKFLAYIDLIPINLES